MAQGVLIPTTPRLVYSGCFDTRNAINFTVSWGAITAADNAGKLQLQGAGAHGIDATAAPGAGIILSGTGLPLGVYTILTRDSANNITVDTPSAGVSAVVAQMPATFTSPAATWTTLSVSDASGYPQVTSAGVHGLTTASVGRFITLTGTNWPGQCIIRSIVNVNSITLDMPYSAGLGTPVAVVAGTATANTHPVIAPVVTLADLGPCGSIEADIVLTAVAGAGSKSISLRPGLALGSTTVPGGYSMTIANTVTEARYKLGAYNVTAGQFIVASASSTVGTSFGTGTGASVLTGRSTTTNTTGGVGICVGTADEAIQVRYCRVVAFPTIR